MNRSTMSRRHFFKAASVALGPLVLPSRILFGNETPSKRITTGHIGVGGQGSGLLRGFLGIRECQPVAAADPFQCRAQAAADQMEVGAKAYQDFREVLARPDIDAVVIGTPDHWHVPIAIAAIKAGKDVYVEKPLGISIEQNKAIREVVHRYGAIFQYGTQQRSFNTHCAFICELVRNGYIGELKEIRVVAPNGASGGHFEPQCEPADFDYDMWLGPAPIAPYTKDRVIGMGRWHIYDYAIGFIAGWGAHPLDIAHWAYPHTPVEYEGTGVIPTEGLYDTVVNWDVQGVYSSGVKFTLKAGGNNNTRFIGNEGWVEASREGRNASSPSLLQIKLKPEDMRLLQDSNHYRNFISAAKTRRAPASDIDSAVQSDIMSHLGDIAIRTGRKILWDEKRETILGDEMARRMMTRSMREPWAL